MKQFAVFAALCAALLYVVPVPAQPEPSPAPAPVVAPKISGPDTAVVGEIVNLEAEASGAAHYAWHVDASAVQLPTNGGDPETLEKLAEAARAAGFDVKARVTSTAPSAFKVLDDDAHRIQLATFPGTYKVLLAVATDRGIVLVSKQVVVTGAQPPPPGPTPVPPGPGPAPTPTPSRFGLTPVLKQVVAGVTSKTKATDQIAIADAISQARGNTSLTDPQKLIDAVTSTLSQKLSKEQQDAWSSFSSAYELMLNALQVSEKLGDNIQDWRDALAEVEASLR